MSDVTLDVLDREECLALLVTAPIGRVVFTDRALPAVQPVNFALDRGEVVFRTAPGTKLAAATRNAVVAFEADEFDPLTRTGWSVVVTGAARETRDPADIAHLARTLSDPWAPGERQHYVRISPQLVTGRRIRRAEPAIPAGSRHRG